MYRRVEINQTKFVRSPLSFFFFLLAWPPAYRGKDETGCAICDIHGGQTLHTNTGSQSKILANMAKSAADDQNGSFDDEANNDIAAQNIVPRTSRRSWFMPVAACVGTVGHIPDGTCDLQQRANVKGMLDALAAASAAGGIDASTVGRMRIVLAGLPGIDLTPPTALQRFNQAIVSAVATAGAPDGVVIAMDWDVRETIGPGAGASPHVWWQAGTGALTGFAT